MKIPTVAVFLNRSYPNKDGKSKVYIRVTYQRKIKYYPLDILLESEEFDKIMTAQRRKDNEREIYDKIRSAENKASEAIKSLPVFSFEFFEKKYLAERASIGTIKEAFDSYIIDLQSEDRFSTSESYQNALNSLLSFKKDIKLIDITPKFLKQYEMFMLKQKRSITTVGIYLRSLRSILNREQVDKSIYPFGISKQGKYEIPTARNIKKALTLEDIIRIANYDTKTESEDFARDMFILSFQCNGMNIKDLISLKWSNIDNDMILFHRAKTANTKKEKELIQVSLKDESKEIIQKWKNTHFNIKDSDPFVFPFLKKGMTPKEIRRTTMQVIKNINKYMKLIGKNLGIELNLTTYVSRHSFSTILKRSGVSIEFISDALGHSSTKTTSNYLAGFEAEAIHEQTAIIGGLKKKA